MAAPGGAAGAPSGSAGFSAGILGRWAPWAARSPAAGRALSGLAARAVGQVRAPAAAPLWKPRLLPGNPPRGGGTSILSRYRLRRFSG